MTKTPIYSFFFLFLLFCVAFIFILQRKFRESNGLLVFFSFLSFGLFTLFMVFWWGGHVHAQLGLFLFNNFSVCSCVERVVWRWQNSIGCRDIFIWSNIMLIFFWYFGKLKKRILFRNWIGHWAIYIAHNIMWICCTQYKYCYMYGNSWSRKRRSKLENPNCYQFTYI